METQIRTAFLNWWVLSNLGGGFVANFHFFLFFFETPNSLRTTGLENTGEVLELALNAKMLHSQCLLDLSEKFDTDLKNLQPPEEKHFLNPRLSISTRFLSRFQDRIR